MWLIRHTPGTLGPGRETGCSRHHPGLLSKYLIVNTLQAYVAGHYSSALLALINTYPVTSSSWEYNQYVSWFYADRLTR